ncbi:MMPL family transporter [Capillimicrobium parvum]|uniref:Membrane protein YdfJ n=1 Tax=Capillimicrobium parvum TaxID=2884022 RepID=A0A9E6XVS8_9ACTN|nr:MMPL family transporter [Capillimicrobium parvum]UGS35110.1 Membrane protein YdfJ [Capillimicrobium parvum]
MTRPLYWLGGFCGRRHWIVLAIWAVILAGIVFWAQSAGQELNNDLTLPGTGSQSATDLLTKRFPAQANGTNPVVLVAPDGKKLTGSKFKDPIDNTVKTLRDDSIVRSATDPLSVSSQLSKDDTIGYISLNLKVGAGELTEDQAATLRDETKQASDAGLAVSFGGYVGDELSKPAVESSEVVGMAMAIIVLLFTFGTVVAMGMPIITAIIGLGAGISIITLLGHVVEVPTVAPTLATMIGLGVGIDYALFIVTRYREHLHGGMGADESIARSVASSGGAVVFAGSTVIVALVSLAVVRIPLVSTLGYTAAIMVAVAVLAAITLLPALLGVIGRHIDSLRMPWAHKLKGDAKPHGWMAWGRFVAHRPIPSALVALVVLGVLAAPILDLYLGQQDDGSLPKEMTARQSFDALSKGFGPGANGPFLISVDMSKKPAKADQDQIDQINQQEKQQKQKAQDQADQQEQQLEAQGLPPDQAQAQVQPQLNKQLDQISQQADDQKQQAENPATDPRLQTLRDDLKKTDGVHSVTQPDVNNKGTAAVMSLQPTTAPADQSTADLVTTLRDDVIPKADKGADMKTYVGGTTAGYVDLAAEISSRLVLTIVVVIALSFLLLMLAFRSIVIPATAGIMNLLSIGAAFGVVTAVFEKGWGASLVGLDGPVAIVSYVPLMMFAVLFGLSMDYEVFLMSHVREAWQRTRDNRTAVIEGIGTTGRVITSAALIMVSVFFAFILNGDPTVKQFGVGMGVAVAVDATLVRCLLVPAVMVLLGRANWWFPRWLDRIMPNFSIEGEEWFRKRDEEAAAAAERRRPDPVPAGD